MYLREILMDRTAIVLASSLIAAGGTKGVLILSGITGKSPECLRAIESTFQIAIDQYCTGLSDAGLWMIVLAAAVVAAGTFILTKPQDFLDVVELADMARGAVSSEKKP